MMAESSRADDACKMPPDLQQRLQQARTERSRIQYIYDEYFRFADPSKPRMSEFISGSLVENESRAAKEGTLFDATLQEVQEDFVSDLVALATPRTSPWVAFVPEPGLSDETKAELTPLLEGRSERIFSAIAHSNYYDEASTEWAGNLAVGTAAVFSLDPGKAMPLRFEAIPNGQLLIGRGAWGGIGFQAREWMMPLEDAVAFWPKYRWPAEYREKMADDAKKRDRVRVCASATRIYDERYEEAWQWRVCVNDDLIRDERLTGRGCSPITVTRWRTFSTSAWGIGPGLKCMPDARTLDQERYLVLKNMGKMVDPPFFYEDDGTINVDGGVQAGDWIAGTQGTKPPVALLAAGKMDLAYLEQAGLQDNVRRAMFQYGPRQRGKTPPTLGQWMDERNEESRRLESPAAKVFAEGVLGILNRVEYLLVKRGEIDAQLHSKGGKLVKVVPLSPLARQQGSAEVSTAMQILNAAQTTLGPQVTAAVVDTEATFKNIKERLADTVVVLRDPQAAQGMLNAALGADQGGGAAPQADPAAGGADPNQGMPQQ